jgi:hypothetical protein
LKAYFRIRLRPKLHKSCCSAAAHAQPKERAAQFTSACNGEFACERFSVSKVSPGPVLDDETLVFIVSDPQTLLKDGFLHPQSVKFVFDSGLSVLRSRAPNPEFCETWKALKASSDAKNKGRYFHGVYNFQARSVRNCQSPRAVAVFDTGLTGRRHHSDVMAIPTSKGIQQKRLSKALIEAIGTNFTSVNHFRDGIFMNHANPNSFARPPSTRGS